MLQEFILHKWADTEHKQLSYFNSTALAEQHGGADEDADPQGAVHEDAALASSGDDADTASVDTDDTDDGDDGGDSDYSGHSGRGGAHAAPEDEFGPFFRRGTCVGHTCSSGAHAAVPSWFYRSSASNRPHWLLCSTRRAACRATRLLTAPQTTGHQLAHRSMSPTSRHVQAHACGTSAAARR